MADRRILSLWFPRLAVERLLRQRRPTLPIALAVVADQGGAQVLVSLNPEAEAAGLRALDVGGARRGVEHPLGVDGLVQRTRDTRPAAFAEPAGQHVDETGAAVGLRRPDQHVGGAGLPPAVGDRPGGLHRGQRVAEAVGRDEHSHTSRLRAAGSGCIPGDGCREVTWLA